jgi:hypothetical protein
MQVIRFERTGAIGPIILCNLREISLRWLFQGASPTRARGERERRSAFADTAKDQIQSGYDVADFIKRNADNSNTG